MACASQTLLDFDLVDRAAGDRHLLPRLLRQRRPRLRRAVPARAPLDRRHERRRHARRRGRAAGRPARRASRTPRRRSGSLRGTGTSPTCAPSSSAPSAYIVLDDASADLAPGARRGRPGRHRARLLPARRGRRAASGSPTASAPPPSTARSPRCSPAAAASARTSRTSLISLCRHAGLPARYVSGYLGNVAEASASHAWAEAFVPPYGWVGIDATLGRLCTGRHVKVGVGRDYADVAVLRGTYHGGGEATLEVSVSSESLDGTADLGGLRRRRRRRARARSWRSRTSAPCASYQRRTIPLRRAVALLAPARRPRRPAAAARPAGRRGGRSDAAAAPAAAGGAPCSCA